MLSATHKAALRYAANPSNCDVSFLCADGTRVDALGQLASMRCAFFDDLIRSAGYYCPQQRRSPSSESATRVGSDGGDGPPFSGDDDDGDDGPEGASPAQKMSASSNDTYDVPKKTVKVPVSSAVIQEILYFLYTDSIRSPFRGETKDVEGDDDIDDGGDGEGEGEYIVEGTAATTCPPERVRTLIQVAAASHRFHLADLQSRIERTLLNDERIHPCMVLAEARAALRPIRGAPSGDNDGASGGAGGAGCTKRLIQTAVKKIRSDPAKWLLSLAGEGANKDGTETEGDEMGVPGVLHLEPPQLKHIFKFLGPAMQFKCLQRWIEGPSHRDEEYNDEEREDSSTRAERVRFLLSRLDFARMNPRFLHERVRPSGLVPMEKLFEALFRQLPGGDPKPVPKTEEGGGNLAKTKKRKSAGEASSGGGRASVTASPVASAKRNKAERGASVPAAKKNKRQAHQRQRPVAKTSPVEQSAEVPSPVAPVTPSREGKESRSKQRIDGGAAADDDDTAWEGEEGHESTRAESDDEDDVDGEKAASYDCDGGGTTYRSGEGTDKQDMKKFEIRSGGDPLRAFAAALCGDSVHSGDGDDDGGLKDVGGETA